MAPKMYWDLLANFTASSPTKFIIHANTYIYFFMQNYQNFFNAFHQDIKKICIWTR